MASWLLQSAFTHILWYPKGTKMQSGKMMGHPDGVGKSPKCLKDGDDVVEKCISGFQMPLHYPRYTKADYGKMEEWKVDMLLREYGLTFKGTLEEKRGYAMGAFLWPDQV